jgi:hypothetical protein
MKSPARVREYGAIIVVVAQTSVERSATMKFVALFSLKEGVDQNKIAEIVNRRADYDHPVQLIEEFYTPNRSPSVIAVYETDDANALVMNSLGWLDAFDIQVIPVVGWQEGIDTLKR